MDTDTVRRHHHGNLCDRAELPSHQKRNRLIQLRSPEGEELTFAAHAGITAIIHTCTTLEARA